MMSDRFKFRVWDNVEEEYIEDLDIIRLTQYGKFVFNNAEDNIEPELNPKRFIFEQCTSIKDESEDLIYEGDIVELDDGTELVNAVIKWDNNAGCWNIRTYDTIYTFDNLYGNELRVIGNIHTDKNLLEFS